MGNYNNYYPNPLEVSLTKREMPSYSEKDFIPEGGHYPDPLNPFETLRLLGETIDYYTGAPVRSALKGYSESVKNKDIFPEWEALKAFGKSFTRKPSEGPTGKDVAQSMGISPVSFKQAGEKMGYPSDLYPDISPAGIAGTGIEAVGDLSSLIPGGALLKGGLKYVDDAGEASKNIIKVYHGTSADLTDDFIFNKKYLGKNYEDEASKSGFFFTNKPAGAGRYGDNVGEFELNIDKNRIEKISDDDISDYTKEWLDELEDIDPEEYEYQMSTKEYENTQNINKGFELAVTDKLKKSSNDAVEYTDEYGEKWIIVKEPSKINFKKRLNP